MNMFQIHSNYRLNNNYQVVSPKANKLHYLQIIQDLLKVQFPSLLIKMNKIIIKVNSCI